MTSSLPRQLGYHMPAEWEPHESTWLAWPHNPDTWPGKIEPIPDVWAQMIAALTTGEKVNLLVNSAEMKNQALICLTQAKVDMSKVFFFEYPTNDCWMRDAGPIFVTRELKEKKNLAITDWIFNKWGGKYPPWELDNLIPQQIARDLKLPSFQPGIVLEGGSIDVNGQGALLTTESCLLNKNRNPHLTKKQIEQYLGDYLGINQVLWLGDGIMGDDTDGHIDDITRFINPTTIVTVVEEDPEDDNYKLLQDNLERLTKMKDLNGKPFTLVKLPMPGPVNYDDQRLPASYANFYIANKVVLLPTYRHQNDQIAAGILQKFFPDRKIVGIDATDLIWGLGAFHCITQQQPAI
jgi:agmatine deiminase